MAPDEILKLALTFAAIFGGVKTEFIDVHRKMQPQYTYPEKEWEQACDDVAANFKKYEDLLENYVRKHGAVTSKAVRPLIEDCINLASTNKFIASSGEVTPDQNTAAEKFLQNLKACEEKFLAEVQSSP